MKILVFDNVGTVGSAVALCLKDLGHDVIGFAEEQSPVCQTIIGSYYDLEHISSTIQNGNFDAIINCTAVINQDAEENKAHASYINTFFPHFLSEITRSARTVLVHRSTDCIFSGEKGSYTLQDVPDAKSFYARSKTLGEVINSKDITIRTSLIGPELNPKGKSLFNWFNNQEGKVNGYSRAIWTGLTTIEYAKVIDYLLRTGQSGLFQCVPNEKPISKYDLLVLFEEIFPKGRTVVKVENNLVDKSLIPELHDSGLKIASYRDMIKQMRDYIEKHNNLYKHYLKEGK